MKQRFIATLVAMALVMTTYVSFGSGRLFGDIGQRDDITSLYIGKTLLRLVGSSVTGSLPGVDIENIADSLDSIEIVTGDSVKAKKFLAAQTVSIIGKLQGLEEALVNDDGDDKTYIYVQSDPAAPDIISRLLIIQEEEDEYQIISMTGKIPVSVLEDLSD